MTSTRVTLGTAIAAVAAIAVAVVWNPSRELSGRAVVLAALGVVAVAALHVEVVRLLDRRRGLSLPRRPHAYVSITWSVTATLLLPLAVALAVTAVVTTEGWWRSWCRVPARTAIGVVASAVTASAVMGLILVPLPADVLRHDPVEPLGLVVVVAVAARWAVAAVLVRLCSATRSPGAALVARRPELLLSGAAAAVGLAVAVLGVRSPLLLVVLVLPLAAIHREAQLHQLGRIASTDAKTALVTAVAWRRDAQRLLTRTRRGRVLGVLMVDLDAFKAVNDRHGHLVGDTVLTAVAGVLRSVLRPTDLAGRFGGEEFVVALGDLDPDDAADRAVAVAERIGREVRSLVIPLEGAAVLRGLSVSVGVAVSPSDGDTLDEVVLAADAAMYEAKRAGRDTVRRARAADADPPRTDTPVPD